jgi:hypothetical protein
MTQKSDHCGACNRSGEQLAEGCLEYFLYDEIEGVRYDAVRVGDAEDYVDDPTKACPECGAKPGTFHHSFCMVEACPYCGSHLANCGHTSGEDGVRAVYAFDRRRTQFAPVKVSCCRDCRHVRKYVDPATKEFRWYYCGLPGDAENDYDEYKLGNDGIMHCCYWERRTDEQA